MIIIAAVNSDWGIGFNGTQSIVIPEDRRRFKTLTDGGVVIVGRKTYEDFGRPLPNRKNIVLTRDPGYVTDGAVVMNTIDGALREIADEPPDRVFIIGGAGVYTSFLPLCTHAYITKIEATPPSDTFFPNLDEHPDWKLSEQGQIHDWNDVRYSFVLYKKV